MENVMNMENANVKLDGRKMTAAKDSVRINVMIMESAHQKEFVFVEDRGEE